MNSKYWEEEIETMPREQLRQLQLQRLKKTIAIAANSPFYKKVFQENDCGSRSYGNGCFPWSLLWIFIRDFLRFFSCGKQWI